MAKLFRSRVLWVVVLSAACGLILGEGILLAAGGKRRPRVSTNSSGSTACTPGSVVINPSTVTINGADVSLSASGYFTCTGGTFNLCQVAVFYQVLWYDPDAMAWTTLTQDCLSVSGSCSSSTPFQVNLPQTLIPGRYIFQVLVYAGSCSSPVSPLLNGTQTPFTIF